jgi:hypothetical protein
MSDRDMDELARWMAAEQGESWDDADALFATLASRYLPLGEAPAGLSGRIFAAIPRQVAVSRFPAFADFIRSWWARATVAASVLVLGLALGALRPGQLFAFAPHAIEVSARLVHGVSASLTAALGLWGVSWSLLGDLGHAAIVVTTSGQAPTLIGASLLLACAAFAGLTRLLSPREECY